MKEFTIKAEPLLRCPFCNSEVKMMDIGEGEHDHYYMIQCQNPNCDGATCYGENSKEEVAKRWNTRKPMERIVEQLEGEHAKEMIFGFNNINDPFAKACSDNKACAYAKAIEIVKGEKDVDNHND